MEITLEIKAEAGWKIESEGTELVIRVQNLPPKHVKPIAELSTAGALGRIEIRATLSEKG
jgi:hypothetical protein